jgi:hypothetical protein
MKQPRFHPVFIGKNVARGMRGNEKPKIAWLKIAEIDFSAES